MTELDELRGKIEARKKGKTEYWHGMQGDVNQKQKSECYGYVDALGWVLSLFDEHFSAEKGSKGAKT